MSDPFKSPTKDLYTALSAADTRLILYGSICYEGSKLDTEKLALLAGMKPISAGSNYLRARRRLEKIVGGHSSDASLPPTKTKSRAPAKRRATKKASKVTAAENNDDTEVRSENSENLLTTTSPKRRKIATPDDNTDAEVTSPAPKRPKTDIHDEYYSPNEEVTPVLERCKTAILADEYFEADVTIKDEYSSE
ncbi:hypothetical protein PENANT_c027G11033 [Penicillium antarcticum]|uniref:Uncharacterized protein n=1 Tax=Penicillium antarcticum TaxID=416450 RepID=A0A1V6PXD9_9EURO|nr:uncharacterized protein N7508_003273 [Penicillium antarcticum]KAJ5312443.1 hypothetical protein N7508_003273 [Penicillium antarcticum]OQD81387.1 hypothetical protein PENANT_c027G11033 [Penicillium antarcticum]